MFEDFVRPDWLNYGQHIPWDPFHDFICTMLSMPVLHSQLFHLMSDCTKFYTFDISKQKATDLISVQEATRIEDYSDQASAL